MSYSAFARYYDCLTRNVDYAARADYFCAALECLRHRPGLTLDLACGTGSLTLELAKRGFDVFGLDASPEMLSAAQRKTAAAGFRPLLICQKMQEMDLYAPVDTMVCMLDSINHLTAAADVRETFRRAARFLNPGGCLLFDANTRYKHRFVLADRTYVYDMEEVYCVWRNTRAERNGRVGISLDFFERRGNVYVRSFERFYERAYPIRTLVSMLEGAGLEPAAVWRDGEFRAPGPRTERIVVAARKPA